MDRDREKDLRDARFALRHPYSLTAVMLQEALPYYITKLISTEAEMKAKDKRIAELELLETKLKAYWAGRLDDNAAALWEEVVELLVGGEE